MNYPLLSQLLYLHQEWIYKISRLKQPTTSFPPPQKSPTLFSVRLNFRKQNSLEDLYSTPVINKSGTKINTKSIHPTRENTHFSITIT
jgi:hypothetical protein